MRRGFIVTCLTGTADVYRRVEERVPNRQLQPTANPNQSRQLVVAMKRLTEAEINRYCAPEPETNLTTQEHENSQSVSGVESTSHQVTLPDPEKFVKEIIRLKTNQKMLISSFSKRIESMSKQLNELKLCVVEENDGNFSSA